MANSKQSSNLLTEEQEEFYHRHIKLKTESGLSRAQYCKRHKLNYRMFGYYERMLPSTNDFLPIQLVTDNEEILNKPQILCSIIFKNGNELKVHNSSVLPTLISLLS